MLSIFLKQFAIPFNRTRTELKQFSACFRALFRFDLNLQKHIVDTKNSIQKDPDRPLPRSLAYFLTGVSQLFRLSASWIHSRVELTGIFTSTKNAFRQSLKYFRILQLFIPVADRDKSYLR